MIAPLPIDETQRLASLRQYAVLDTPPEAAFDDLTLLAAQICQTPIAMVSLVDEERQWFKSKIGVTAQETAREIAFCAHAILQPERVLEVRDALADPRFATNPLVATEPHIRFYAGAPLVTPAGHALGALCVVDRTPRELTPDQERALQALSRHVVTQLELRRQARVLQSEVAEREAAEARLREQNEELARREQEARRLLVLAEQSRSALLSVLEDEQQAEQGRRESDRRFREMLENLQLIALTMDCEGRITFCNDYLLALTGWRREEVLGEDWFARFVPAGHPQARATFFTTLAANSVPAHADSPIQTRAGEQREIVWNNTLLRDESGGVAGTASIGVDMTERRRAEHAVRENAEFTEAVLNSLAAHVAVLNEAGIICCANDAWRRFAQENALPGAARDYLGENYLTACITKIAGQDDPLAQVAAVGIRAVLDGSQTDFQLEYPCHSPTERRWFLMRVTRLQGRSRGVVIAHQDITQRRLAEEELRESETRFRQLAENIDEVFWITNPAKDQMLYISPAFETVWGRTCASLYAAPLDWLAAILPEDRERILDAATTQQVPGTYDEEYRIVRPDGAQRWIRDQAFPVRDDDGQVRRIVGMARDITERRHAETVLRESQQLLEKAQQIGHVGSWVSDPAVEGRLHWSAETCRIFGYPVGEFDGRVATFFAHLHPEDRDRVSRVSEAALAGAAEYDLEHRIVRRDGQTRWVHEQADVERDSRGQPVRMVGVVQDITERKELEARLRESQKMEAIGQLAGGIAHDFNNILAAILGNAELIKLFPAGSSESADCLESILVASHRAKDLVRQILAFSRRQEQQRQAMQLHHIVKEALKLMRASVPAAVEFRASLPPTPTVLADPSEIHQVTMNLCTNAWHALQDRAGLITVDLAETVVDEAQAKRYPDLLPGHYVRLRVADTGCGMDAATLEHIFEPFFTTKPVGVGTGLGLAVVHGIVKSHDGGVVVHSEPGAGTTFELYFPVFEAEALPPPTELSPIPLGRGEHILFVDDEEPLAKMGKAVLERLGYRVTAQTSPAGALARLQAQAEAFDLVITDFNMPGMNGAALAEQVLALQPRLRLILTTGYSASINAERARALGFRELLPKPYDMRNLGETVRRVLAESSGSS